MNELSWQVVKSVADPLKMGRVLTEKDEWLSPVASLGPDESGYIWVPPVGSRILVVDNKYYVGTQDGTR